MKKSIKAIIAATFTAALLAGCSSNTASTTTAAETTTATATEAAAETTTAESADAADTALADGSYTIGINQFAVHGSPDNCREGFLEGLAENGIVEGKNLTVLEENAQADPGLAAQISTNFAGQKVDLICAIATPSAQSAYSVGRKNDIPVIYTAVTDPVAAELANADGTPVGEVTGTSDKLPVEQQLEMIRAILPDAKKIGIMYTTSEVNSASTLAEYKEKAADYGFEIVESGVSSTADIPLAADSLLEQVDCLNNLTDNTVVASLPLILSKANAKNIPVFGSEIEQVKIGCLAAMGLDYVDIFYHHRPDPETPLEETMLALDSIVKSGKALYVGISNYNKAQTQEAVKILRELKTPFIINQRKYSMFERNIEEDGLKSYAAQNGIGIIAFCPLAQGLLTKKYLHGIPEDSRIRTDGRFLHEDALSESRLAQIRALNNIAENRGQTLAQMALSWVLRDGEVTSVLIGASRASQITENTKIVEASAFTSDELSAIEAVLNA